MNKYAAMGLIQEASKGRRIVVLTGVHSGEAHFAFVEFASLLDGSDEPVKIARSNGRQGFTFHSGGCIDLRRLPGDLRGTSYDVIYLDAELAQALTHEEITHALLPVLHGAVRGELVRP